MIPHRGHPTRFIYYMLLLHLLDIFDYTGIIESEWYSRGIKRYGLCIAGMISNIFLVKIGFRGN